MKSSKKMMALICCVLLVVTPVLNISADDLTEAQQERNALEQELKDAKELIQGLKNSKDDIETKVQQLDEQLTNISLRIHELERQLDQKKLAIEDTSELLVQAQADSVRQYDLMKKRIKYMYEKGVSMSLLDAFLTSGSIAEFISRAEYIKAITAYDRKMLEKYQGTQKYMEAAKDNLEADYAALEKLREQVETERQTVQDLVAAKEEQLEVIQEDISQAQENADTVQAEIDAQNAIMNQIREEEARKAAEKKAAEEAAKKTEEEKQASETGDGDTGQPSEGGNDTENGGSGGETPAIPADDSYGGGGFVWPVPSSKRVTSDFGTRLAPTAGASSNHQGIDIGAGYGAEIVAAAAGTVVFAGYSSGMGNYLMISHGSSIYTVYGHCSVLLVSGGVEVKAGQTIAQVGSTGISTANHLHFGVSYNGSYVSPWNYLSK